MTRPEPLRFNLPGFPQLVSTQALQGNPYLEAFLAVDRLQPPLEQWRRYRNVLSGHYAYAVPTPAALAEVARHAPLVEIGAGGGYWARLLRDAGVDMLAYDIRPPGSTERVNQWFSQWTPWTTIAEGMAPRVAEHPDRTLFLCWPLWNVPVASNSLRWYAGEVIVYVGEGYGGSTGDPAFHELLDRHFELETWVPLPQWPDRWDSLTVWRRSHPSPPPGGGLFGSMFVGGRDRLSLGSRGSWRSLQAEEVDGAAGGNGKVTATDSRGGEDEASGVPGPQPLPATGVEEVDAAVAGADHHQAVADGGAAAVRARAD